MNGSKSWGRNFNRPPQERLVPNWLYELERIPDWKNLSNLAYGLGRSYGDSCLNGEGRLIMTQRLNRILNWDKDHGVIHVEAGVSFQDLLTFIVPFGWFLPVTPGTQFVTLGGAIANDVHGKNHHRSGTIAQYIKSFTLLRSSGEVLTCSLSENAEMFKATIGGLGLTGMIMTVEFQLIFASPILQSETIPFSGIDEFTSLSRESQEFDYTVAWIDCVNAWSPWGRGLFMRANHSAEELGKKTKRMNLSVPIEFPKGILNRYTCKLFNEIYYRSQLKNVKPSLIWYEPFFYPLDSVKHWNRIYGSKGLLQFQMVIPLSEKEALTTIFQMIGKSGYASFLAVLKTFGSIPSPGLLSFPKEGYTLALDFANRGAKTARLMENLTSIVKSSGGRLYPAKDSLMTSCDFEAFYPHWNQFLSHKDPGFSSDFFRRVSGEV